jgi:CDP-diacylglycerol--glycerol-3-phosphate 3-phosphatidyltransferase
VSAADLVAVLRALAALPIAWAILTDQRPLALAIFVVAALSDALDGWLARRAGATARGAFLDPLADKVLVVGTLAALSIAGTGWPVTVVAIAVAAREVLVGVLRARMFSSGVTLPADRVAKLKSAAEMVGVALIILNGRPWAVLGVGIVGLAFLLSLATLPRYLGRAT